MSFNSPTSSSFSFKASNLPQLQFAFFHSSVAAGLLAPIYIMHFSNILVLASTAVLAVAAPSTGLKKRVKTFKFFGVNESGAEFREHRYSWSTWEGLYMATHVSSSCIYYYAQNLANITSSSTIDTLVGKGLNIFRESFSIFKRLN